VKSNYGTDMNSNITYYNDNALDLGEQYDSVLFESVHKDWLQFVPTEGTVIDIGAGSGRDARYLASKGLKVYAIEPALALMELAFAKSTPFDICWLQDSLPNLDKVKCHKSKFKMILLSAVWMHLTPEERQASMQSFAALLENRGKLVITLRHGKFSDARTSFPISVDEVIELGATNGLNVILQTQLNTDQLGRDNLAWQTLVLEK
jgi:SAM-dependent methyltransferase